MLTQSGFSTLSYSLMSNLSTCAVLPSCTEPKRK